MSTKLDVGGMLYPNAQAVATLSFTPPFDRAAILHRINLSNPSARDTWDLTIGGRVVASFREALNGSNQWLRADSTPVQPNYDFFLFCRSMLDMDPSFPIPNALTLTLASRGGSTADIDFEVEEVDRMDTQVGMLNHFEGRTFLVPLSFFLSAATAVVGPTQVDTQIAPAWVPPLFNNTQIPPGWEIDILALFLDGAGVNTFSGAANHQSTTQDLRLTKNGTLLFSRAAVGIPNRGSASAAGSVNTVRSLQSGIYPPVRQASWDHENVLRVPLTLRPGDALQIQQFFQGDLTGNADYSDVLVNAIAKVTVPSPAGAEA